MIHYAVLKYSRELAAWLIDREFDLNGKKDYPFMQTIFRLCIREFNFQPPLSAIQFFQPNGFAEKKVILTYDLLNHCQQKHKALKKEREPQKKLQK